MRRSFNGNYAVTQPFGVYAPGVYGNYPGSKHPGTDYGVPANQDVVAGMSGTVKTYVRGKVTTGRGNEVVITSSNKQRKVCHLNSITVADGQAVEEGQKIGTCGWTGYVLPQGPAGAHVHDELLIDGQYMSLEDYLNGKEQDMPSTVGAVEIDMISRMAFGYPASQTDIEVNTGRETNEYIRWAYANPSRTAYLKQLEDQAQGGSSADFVPAGELYVKKVKE